MSKRLKSCKLLENDLKFEVIPVREAVNWTKFVKRNTSMPWSIGKKSS